MSSRSTVVVVLACGSVGLAAAYWLFRKQQRKTEKLHSTNPTTVSDPPATDFKQTFESIILSTNITDNPPQFEKITDQLGRFLEYLTPAQIDQLKTLSDEISYAVSEWYFYHTLRTNKSINWNPETGLVDEALSPEERQLGSQLAKAIRQAFWDNHLADLEKSPPDYSRIIERIDELNTRLVLFLKSSSPVLDLDIIKRIIVEKKFSRHFFLQLLETIVQVMYDIESPAAHEDTLRWFKETKTDWEESSVDQAPTGREIISVFRFLFEQLDLVDSEIANFKTSHFPYTKRVEHERDTFRDLVEQSVLPVPRLLELLGTLQKSTTIEDTNSAISKTIRLHVLDLLKGESRCIESLNLDSDEISKLEKTRTRTIVLASFLVGVQSQVNALFPSELAREYVANKAAMTTLLRDVWESDCSTKPDPVGDLTDHLVASLIQSSFEVTNDTVTALRRGIGQCVNKNSKVRQLYDRRVSQLLENGQVTEISLGSSPWFLSLASAKLSELLRDIDRFIADHLTVYLPVYRGLAGKRSLDELD